MTPKMVTTERDLRGVFGDPPERAPGVRVRWRGDRGSAVEGPKTGGPPSKCGGRKPLGVRVPPPPSAGAQWPPGPFWFRGLCRVRRPGSGTRPPKARLRPSAESAWGWAPGRPAAGPRLPRGLGPEARVPRSTGRVFGDTSFAAHHCSTSTPKPSGPFWFRGLCRVRRSHRPGGDRIGDQSAAFGEESLPSRLPPLYRRCALNPTPYACPRTDMSVAVPSPLPEAEVGQVSATPVRMCGRQRRSGGERSPFRTPEKVEVFRVPDDHTDLVSGRSRTRRRERGVNEGRQISWSPAFAAVCGNSRRVR